MIASSTTYHPFGMPLKSLALQAYRFGFNGMEKDPEITGEQGSHLDFGARVYDSRIGRWTALDPLASKYPSLSPYVYVADNPIIFIDPDGRDIVPTNEGAARATSALIQKYDQGDVLDKVFQFKLYTMKDPSTGEEYSKIGSSRINNPYNKAKEGFQTAMKNAGMKVKGEELDESWALYQAVVSDENIEVEAWSPGKSAPRFGSSGESELPSETADDVSGYKDRQTNNENLFNAIEYENPVTNEGLDHIINQEGAEIEANSSGEGYLYYENEGGNSTTKGIIILDSRENMPNSLGNALKEVDYEN